MEDFNLECVERKYNYLSFLNSVHRKIAEHIICIFQEQCHIILIVKGIKLCFLSEKLPALGAIESVRIHRAVCNCFHTSHNSISAGQTAL